MDDARHGPLVIERILRDRESLWREILAQRRLPGLIRRMSVSSAVSLALYGLILGATGGPLQALSSAVKLPLLFGLTLAICLPTLYLFNLVLGARLSIRQALALVLVAITVTGALTIAFGPITLFFLITAQDYAFYKLLNVAILLITGIVGLTVMVDGMRGMNRLSGHAPGGRPHQAPPAVRVPGPAAYRAPQPLTVAAYAGLPPGSADHPGAQPAPASAPPAPATPDEREGSTDVVPARDGAPAGQLAPGAFDRPVSTGLLRVWVLLFGFVGTQLAWTLRPFVGDPYSPFQLFRPIDGNFYGNVLHTIASLFG